MATIRLGGFTGDTIIVHFGGKVGRINAQTFALSLLGFAATAQAINAAIDPYQEIEIQVEADGEGSYRVKLRRVPKALGGFFSRGTEAIFWSIVGALIYDHFIKNDPQVEVQVNTNEVVFVQGKDRIIVPRPTYDQAKNAQHNEAVQEGLSRTFSPLEADPNVTDFGLTRFMEDAKPLIRIPRADFPLFTSQAHVIEPIQAERETHSKARLKILKAWLDNSKRKWSFEWNGVPISAPIKDESFLQRLGNRDFALGSGDAIDVVITYRQNFNPTLGVYENDTNTFVISEVFALIQKNVGIIRIRPQEPSISGGVFKQGRGRSLRLPRPSQKKIGHSSEPT
jgi:hypothetical protein